MKKVKVNDIDYEVIKEYKNGFDREEFLKYYTDYFEPYDYILGDWSYGKLRLKGFCDKKNKIEYELVPEKQKMRILATKTKDLIKKMNMILILFLLKKFH